MNSIIASQFGFILAAQARVLGMQAANQQREVAGESPAYVEHDFNAEAAHIENCATEIARNP